MSLTFTNCIPDVPISIPSLNSLSLFNKAVSFSNREVNTNGTLSNCLSNALLFSSIHLPFSGTWSTKKDIIPVPEPPPVPIAVILRPVLPPTFNANASVTDPALTLLNIANTVSPLKSVCDTVTCEAGDPNVKCRLKVCPEVMPSASENPLSGLMLILVTSTTRL